MVKQVSHATPGAKAIVEKQGKKVFFIQDIKEVVYFCPEIFRAAAGCLLYIFYKIAFLHEFA